VILNLLFTNIFNLGQGLITLSSLKMSEFDMQAASYLNNAILPIILAIIVILLIYKNGKILRQRFFAWMFVKMSKGYNEALDKTKTKLFAELQDFKSLDWDLRNKGLIRILEIGVGPGSNFKFYPKNARVIAVDPNPFFKQFLEEYSSKFPEIKLEQIVLAEGENLTEVKDGSVDIVVTTIVLCSVRDVKQVLREIKRVLAPGGKYFFLEHVLGEKGSRYYRVQKFVGPVWPYLFDGCDVTRDIGRMIDQSGFSKAHITHFIAPLKSIFRSVAGPHIVGTVQK